MSKLLKGLSKLGLVELEDQGPGPSQMPEDDIDKLLASIGSEGGESNPVATMAEPTPVVLQPTIEVSAGQSLEEIYAAAGVPPSPYSAEKLLTLLTGLQALPMAQRLTAVEAMDNADDSWEITDPVRDAEAKIVALQQAKSKLSADVTTARSEAQAKLAQEAEYQEQATAEIRKQIAELEATLQAEVEKCASNKAAIEKSLDQTEESCQREQAKFDSEIQRLSGLVQTFKPVPQVPEGVNNNG